MRKLPRWIMYPLTATTDFGRAERSRFYWRPQNGRCVLSLLGVINGLLPGQWFLQFYSEAEGAPWKVRVTR